jgi:hypothetical protein
MIDAVCQMQTFRGYWMTLRRRGLRLNGVKQIIGLPHLGIYLCSRTRPLAVERFKKRWAGLYSAALRDSRTQASDRYELVWGSRPLFVMEQFNKDRSNSLFYTFNINTVHAPAGALLKCFEQNTDSFP